MKRHSAVLICGLSLVAGLPSAPSAVAQTVEVPNASFEDGDGDKPAAWELTEGQGYRTNEDATDGQWSAVIVGNGRNVNEWRSPVLDLEPNAVYAVRFSARRLAGWNGAPVAGATCANRILYEIDDQWQRITTYFQAPATFVPDSFRLRGGQWHINGTIAYDDFEVCKAEPVYRKTGEFVLSGEETINGNTYTYRTRWGTIPYNHARGMTYHDCDFNESAFMMRAGSQVLFCHSLAGRRQLSGRVTMGLEYHHTGSLAIEASNDEQNWETVGRLSALGGKVIPLPEALFPAEVIWIRLRSDAATSEPNKFELTGHGVGPYEYEARVDGAAASATGKTEYVQLLATCTDFAVRVESVGDLRPGGDNRVVLELSGAGSETRTLPVVMSVTPAEGEPWTKTTSVTIARDKQTVMLPYEMYATGWHDLDITVGDANAYHARVRTFVSRLFETRYGKRLPAPGASVGLWWASSGWKVSRDRPVPTAQSAAIHISAARNEAEAVQLVVRPTHTLRALTARCDGLQGPGGAVVPLDVLRVRYVDVTVPTDSAGAAAPWPDPIPPFASPIDVPGGVNQPLWLRVRVPKDAAPGLYRGTVELAADGFAASVPVEVEVYNFTLPDRMTCETVFGISAGNIYRYHRLSTAEHKRLVIDRYFACLAAHHLSPYDPAPLDRLGVTWPDVKPGQDVDPGSLEVTFGWSRWDAAMEAAFKKYHFNTFRIPVAGMGGKHRKPDLLGFAPDTPEYEALFRSYHGQLEAHLREKGWLDEGYVYWFDEPTEADYAFVKGQYERLKRVARELRRMLTEQVEPELVGGPNLWCPMIHSYQPQYGDERRAAGDRYWWYICTIPKTPYVGAFIDHPGTELRVWLWQTWKHDIDGVLFWTTTYWTSPAGYPDKQHPQNPYEDPMAWVSRAGRGVKRPWGNGDGRLFYPPEAAADGHPKAPVLGAPVESVRVEVLRDGIEDYEYLCMLKRLLDERGGVLSAADRERYAALLEVPDSVSASRRDFTFDPAPIERRRDRIARAIVALSAKSDGD